ncbi:hypothetical protein ANAEL_04807 [Anaerolineales bacterium]|nr:hypothetical protein ANAEL_04807 [Anaerolineales bacterium]
MNNFIQAKTVFQCLRHFGELPDEVQQAIAASASPRHFNAEQVIYVEGEPAESIYIASKKRYFYGLRIHTILVGCPLIGTMGGSCPVKIKLMDCMT